MTARPWFKFFPADWRSDPALRMCSMGARGLWMEMLSLMHEAEPRGHLKVKGAPMSERQLARIVGIETDEIAQLVAELEANGVAKRDATGAFYSRRAIEDAARTPERSPLSPALRQLVFERDGSACRYCGCSDQPFEIDHVLPWSRGGKNDIGNLVLACRPCNQDKRDRTLEEWRQ